MDSLHRIQGSRDQHSFDSFPGLIAVFHALHRLLAPRHPPHALSSLAALIPLSIRVATHPEPDCFQPLDPSRYRPGPSNDPVLLRAHTENSQATTTRTV